MKAIKPYVEVNVKLWLPLERYTQIFGNRSIDQTDLEQLVITHQCIVKEMEVCPFGSDGLPL